MKAAPFSAPPVVGKPDQTPTFKDMLLGQRRTERFYQAWDDADGVYLLWMECYRFGVLRSFPCALRQGEEKPLVFDDSRSPDAEDRNGRLIGRWEALELPDRMGRLRIEPLERKAFQEIYSGFRNGGPGPA